MNELFSKIIERIKENKITLCILIICFIVFSIILNRIIAKDYNGEHEYSYNILTQGSGRTPSIISGEQVSQRFISHKNNLHKIGILALMPGISTDSNVNVKIIETENIKEIYNQDVFLGSLKNTENFEVFIENQANSKNKEYEIIITGLDGNELNSVQFPYSSYPNDLLGECYLADKLQENNLVIKMTYSNYISNRFQVCVWSILLVCSIIFILTFSNDNDLIIKNLNFNRKNMLSSLKSNWYWIISILCVYLLFIRKTKLEYAFIVISLLLDLFILTQVNSIKEKLENINYKVKIFALLSTIGTCYYAKKLFLIKIKSSIFKQFFKDIDIQILDKFAILIAVLSSFIIFALITIFLNYIIEKIKDVFENISKKEKIFYIVLLACILIFVTYMFSNSTAFYGTNDVLFDVLFTSDSGRLVTDENVYLSLYHGENDLRQPLFAVFAIPFIGCVYTISLMFSFFSFGAPLCMNLMQVILLFIANLMISKLLNLKPQERICFVILSFCTYMSLLFSLMMEQYLITYFWMITFIYLACNKKQDELILTATGGTLLTSLALTPFIVNEFSIKKIKEFCVSLLKAGILFVCMLIIFNRIDLVEDLFLKQEQYGTFVDDEINFEYKLKEYTNFVKNCFIAPETYITTENILCPYSFQMVKNTSFNYIGIGIIVLAILGAILNRKDKFSIISFVWISFSYLIIGVIGWGTAENGTILYSLYFGWPFLVLIYKLFQYICTKLKFKKILTMITIILIVLLVVTNYNGEKELLDFAFKYYKI